MGCPTYAQGHGFGFGFGFGFQSLLLPITVVCNLQLVSAVPYEYKPQLRKTFSLLLLWHEVTEITSLRTEIGLLMFCCCCPEAAPLPWMTSDERRLFPSPWIPHDKTSPVPPQTATSSRAG